LQETAVYGHPSIGISKYVGSFICIAVEEVIQAYIYSGCHFDAGKVGGQVL
jgi:hypothetical protein